MSRPNTGTPAHHAPDGRFRNPWPDSEPRGIGAVLRWARERRGSHRSPTPPRNSLPTATPRIDVPHAERVDRLATWVGHSTVLLQFGGLNVLTDPIWSERASPLPFIGPKRIMAPGLPLASLPPLDVVLISHNHYDHLDKQTVRHLTRAHDKVMWVVPLELGRLLRDWGVERVVELDWWQTAEVNGLRVTATPARHFTARGLGDRNQTLWCGYAIEADGHRAYFAGDSAYHPTFGEIGSLCGPFDLIMMPIGAYDPRWFMHVVHMDPEEAVQAYQDTTASGRYTHSPLMLAIHWGTFRLTDEPLDEPSRRALSCWRAQHLPDDRLWVAKFGETRNW